MQHLEGLLKLADREFGKMEQNGEFRNKDEIETVYKLIDIVKDVYCIWDYENNMQMDDHSEYGQYPDNYLGRRSSSAPECHEKKAYRKSRIKRRQKDRRYARSKSRSECRESQHEFIVKKDQYILSRQHYQLSTSVRYVIPAMQDPRLQKRVLQSATRKISRYRISRVFPAQSGSLSSSRYCCAGSPCHP